MKKAMSGFDLRVMARELDALKGAYVKKAYMPHYEQIVLRVNPKAADQQDIVFVRGARIYTSQRDRPMPMTPPPFAMVLRKHLRNARLTGVQQVGFDRVLAFSFDTKNGERTLYVEVFRDGLRRSLLGGTHTPHRVPWSVDGLIQRRTTTIFDALRRSPAPYRGTTLGESNSFDEPEPSAQGEWPRPPVLLFPWY